MTFLIIILITISLWLIFAPYIRPWLQRRAEQKLADYLRRQMGMPTEKEQRKARKEAQRREDRSRRQGFWSQPHPRPDTPAPDAPIIPPGYAEDVEFVEIKEFAQTTIVSDGESPSSRHSVKPESQISDVEYTEIKD